MSSSRATGAFFGHPCADGVDLVLRDLSTTVEMHELTVANIDRLRRWEHWAQPEPTLPRTFEHTKRRLDCFLAGAALPCAISVDGALVGSVELSIDAGAATGELGIWLDAEAEGRGIARAACDGVLDHAFGRLGLQRVEARIATDNDRSRRLTEQLGFSLEGRLRSAYVVGAERHDLAVYGLLAEDRSGLRVGEVTAAA